MDKKKCFVIMPFSQTSEKHTEKYWDVFFELIKNEMEMQQYICTRSETGPHNILKQVIVNLNESDLVIAVLTDMNPNVWYELGIRHSLNNGTLMLLEESHRIPFDISNYGLVKYADDISLANTLKKEICAYLSKLGRNRYFDSPVFDFLGMPQRYKEKIDELYDLVLKISNEKPANSINNIPRNKKSYNRILWVDDYPVNNESIIDLFTNQNIKFDIAISTEQGIDFLREYDYDLIITDMGRGSEPDAGLHFINKVKKLETNNTVPIIVFSSQQGILNYGNKAIESGALAAIYGTGDLVSYISKVLPYSYTT